VVWVRRTTTSWVFRVVIILVIIGWGACPDRLDAAQGPAGPPAPKRHDDPFARFQKLPPDPAPLVPVEQAWLVSLPLPPSAPGALDDARVYIPLGNEWMMALDRETGSVAWTRAIGANAAPLAQDRTLFVASRGAIRALDAATGEDRWTTPIEGAVSAPLVWDSGWVIAVAPPGVVIAFRASDGREIWKRSLGAPTVHPPVPGGTDALYLSLMDGRVVALRLTDGTVLWEQKLPGTLSELAVAPKRVFVGSTDNFFYAFDAEHGKLEWKWRGGGDVIGAAYDGELIYFASLDNIIRAVNPGNGNQRWKKETGTRPVLPPRAFGGIVVLPGVAPAVTVFVAKTGAVMATHNAQAPDGRAQPLLGGPLLDSAVAPFRVALVTITPDGLVEGLRPKAMMFREPALTPFGPVPGRPLTREPAPNSATAKPQPGLSQ
jgi:outer membrane protein assembly factor BamB